ncbi:hypothetical protein [Rhodopila sp.]|uniref:hypothetical protein n=1 Tax=Rhodopila sp. TaxID=2480087 RepID=UPI003D0BCCD5
MTTATRRAMTGATLAGLAAGTLGTVPLGKGTLGKGTPEAAAAEPSGAESLLTVFLRHDESKTLAEINKHLKQTGFFQKFPPPGIEVVSWYVLMGIGQVVTLNVPPDRLREVNRVLEQTARGGLPHRVLSDLRLPPGRRRDPQADAVSRHHRDAVWRDSLGGKGGAMQ